jgi:hypothetical protein
LLQSLHSIALLFSPRAHIIDAREAPSADTQDDQGDERRDELGAFCQELNKARTEGLVSNDDEVIFPSTERIPKPRDSFRVMFLAFLLHGLSLHAYEFLRGLLFVYGVDTSQTYL